MTARVAGAPTIVTKAGLQARSVPSGVAEKCAATESFTNRIARAASIAAASLENAD